MEGMHYSVCVFVCMHAHTCECAWICVSLHVHMNQLMIMKQEVCATAHIAGSAVQLVYLFIPSSRYSLIGNLASQCVLIPASLQSSLRQVFANIQLLQEFSAEKGQWPLIREDVHLSVLIKLVNDLEKFLVPFFPFQKFVVHFSLHPNHFFQAFYAKANSGGIVTVTDARQGDGHEVGINYDSPDRPKDIQNIVTNEPMDGKNFIYMEVYYTYII